MAETPYLRSTDDDGRDIDPKIKEAMERLWSRMERDLREKLNSHIDDLGEMAETVMMRVSQRMDPKEASSSEIEAVLWRAFQNLERDILRRDERLVSTNSSDEWHQTKVKAGWEPFTTMPEGEDKVLSGEVLGQMPEQAQAIFILRSEGYSFDEIGQILGIPADNAKAQYFYWRDKIKKRIEKESRFLETRRRFRKLNSLYL